MHSLVMMSVHDVMAQYLEPVEDVAVGADADDDAGGQNEELHHLQGLLLAQRCLMPGLISALHHN